MSGRIGRLRYLAFSWAMVLPILAIVGLGLLSGGLTHRGSIGGPFILLFIILMIAYLWTAIRVMVLRLHDLNRSGMWVLALFIAAIVVTAVSGLTAMNTLSFRVFTWLVGLALLLWPGTHGDNDYGSPPGANSFWVFAGALVLPVTLIFAVLRMGRIPH